MQELTDYRGDQFAWGLLDGLKGRPCYSVYSAYYRAGHEVGMQRRISCERARRERMFSSGR